MVLLDLFLCFKKPVKILLCSHTIAVSFAQIDWHDFVVVETVEFKENETGQYSLLCPLTNTKL